MTLSSSETRPSTPLEKIHLFDPLHNRPINTKPINLKKKATQEPRCERTEHAIAIYHTYLVQFIKDLFRNIPLCAESDPLLTAPEKQTEIETRTQEIVGYCQHLLPEILRKPTQKITTRQYEEIKRAIVDVYALTAPCSDTTEYTLITQTKKRTGLTHVSDDQIVWLPEIHNPAWGDDRLAYKHVQDLSPSQKRVVDLWWERKTGLIDHTLIAAEFIRQLVRHIQANLRSFVNQGISLNETQKQVLDYDPNLIAIKMMFHDMGRLVTHDREGHETMTQTLLKKAGVHADWREEPSIIHHFTKEYPTSIWDINEDNPIGLLYHFADVVSKGDQHIKHPEHILDQLNQRKAHYAEQGKSLDEIRHTQHGYYIDYEAIMIQEILLWLEDEQGLAFPRKKLAQVYKKTEKYMHRMRRALGLRQPPAQTL